jgi:hypothetical protein
VGRVWPRHGHRGRPLNAIVSWHFPPSIIAMNNTVTAWLNTRPKSQPDQPIPPRGPEVVAFARAVDGTTELRIIQRPGRFTYEFESWANFDDAGGNAHHGWHTFPSSSAIITDSFEIALERALEDAAERGLKLHSVVKVTANAS